MKKDDVNTIKINLISSAIWQIFLSIFMSLSITKQITPWFSSILDKFEINHTVITVLIFIIIETVLICIIFLILTKVKINTKNVNNKTDKNNENTTTAIAVSILQDNDYIHNELNVDYYFEDYTKHITIYKNGNGIIMNTFNIVVNNYENFNEFKRKINVEDGKKDLIFPSLRKMKATNKDRRFEDFGFWVYKPTDSIISSTIEKYWADNDPDEIDIVAERNNKELRWIFEINKNKVKKSKIHKVAYAISIPGLYPIEKGQFVKEIANDPEKNGRASTSIHVEHYIKKITYILSFEDGIKLNKEPECFTINGKKIRLFRGNGG